MEHAPFRQLPGDPRPAAEAFRVGAEDGVHLRMALWRRQAGHPRGTVLLFPGRTEYVEKYATVADDITAAGYEVLAIDWRGQGLSDRLQADPRPGHVGQFADYQRDVVEMVVAAQSLDLPQPWHLLAHSMGGCIGLAALHGGLPVTTAAFSAPMWGINLRRIPHGLALGVAYMAGRLQRGGHPTPGNGSRGTYVLEETFAANLLTPDIEAWVVMLREAVAWPDLTIGGASYDWVGRALNECRRLATLDSPDLPMLVSLGSEERIVSVAAIRDRAARWSDAYLMEIEGARHEVMMDAPERRQAFLDAAIGLFDSVG